MRTIPVRRPSTLPALALALCAALALGAAPAPSAGAEAQQPPESGAAAASPALSEKSTLADWKRATTAERSRVAVAIARGRLAPDAPKIDVATMAMEITGCVSATARDPRFDQWTVAPTARTCLTAPERPAP